MLLSWHNLAYYQDLMADLRAAIAEGTLAACAEKVFTAYARSAESSACAC
jgi:queuine tRNA-ribosyltransferase